MFSQVNKLTKIKKQKFSFYSYFFTACSVLLLLISMFLNQHYFHELSLGSVYIYQLKQVLCVLFLFATGYLFLKVIQHKLSDLWCYIMAFPSAVCLWCFMSQFLLLADFTYRFWRVLFLMFAFIIFCYGIRRLKGIPLCKPELPILPTVSVIIGIACLVSTGYNYIIMNYDSYYYFANYGKAITLLMSYKDIVSNNSFVMTNIGQFLPMVSAYATFWGLDTMYPIHSFMIINIIVAYAVCIYESAIHLLNRKRSVLYTLMFTFLLVSCSLFMMFTNWILSNSWIMFYLFLMFYLGFTYDENNRGVDRALLICGFAAAITMLRKDGAIFACFIFVCYSLKKMYHGKLLALLFLPAAGYQLFYLYYLKHIIYAVTSLAVANSMLNSRLRLLLTAAILATMIYLLFFQKLTAKIFGKFLPHVFTLGLFAVFFLFAAKDIPIFIDFIDAWIRNFFGTAFGYSSFCILLLCCLIILSRTSYDYSMFMLIGYVLITFIIYLNKGNLETNVDNSGLRALYQIVTVFFCISATKILPLFVPRVQPVQEENTADHTGHPITADKR